MFAWNDGAPSYLQNLGDIDTQVAESNPGILDGALVGQPGRQALYYNAGSVIRWQWVDGAPPLAPAGSPAVVTSLDVAGTEGDPNPSADGTRMVLTKDSDLWEATGSGPDAWNAPSRIDAVSTGDTEYDPTISPDGRVLVFSRVTTGGNDLFVSRRADPASPFPAAVALPGAINTGEDEANCFLAANGDLLFTRSTSAGYVRVWLARAIVP